MKKLLISLLFVVSILVQSISCKKKPINYSCGCDATDIKYFIKNIEGTLSYYQHNSKWVFSYQPIPGNHSNYFPCNTDQDSINAILKVANQSQIFQVKISGKVKKVCSNEDFGIISGVATFDYIIIDSIKRN